MKQDNNIVEIPVKVILTGEFKDFDSWIKNTQECLNKLGVTVKLLHLDKNGFATNGYDLKNHQHTKPYPVKTYLLVQDPAIIKPLPHV